MAEKNNNTQCSLENNDVHYSEMISEETSKELASSQDRSWREHTDEADIHRNTLNKRDTNHTDTSSKERNSVETSGADTTCKDMDHGDNIATKELVKPQVRASTGKAALAGNTKWTKTHAHFVMMGGFTLVFSDGYRYRLNASQFLALLRRGDIGLPKISKKDVEDKSKADGFTKALACLQVGWLVLSSIGRISQQLPVTTLELFALGDVLCAFFTYWAWWQKPKDVGQPHSIPMACKRNELIDFLESTEYVGDVCYAGIRISLRDGLGRAKTGMNTYYITFVLPTLAFGTIHLLAWNSYFPTSAEQILWRSGSLACLVFPLILVTGGLLVNHFRIPIHTPLKALCFLLCLMYGLSRAYLVVEIFVGLRRVPAAVYQDINWLQFLPHFG